ncbi:MAG TPA: hypothetical protein PJ991_06225 [Kiritimatiellia bacterium]|nr:hypothetical protein [Kiritimatiellia bacterium]
MTGLFRAKNWAWFLITGMLLQPGVLLAQDYFAADVLDIKRRPQNYWARGVVFRDVLTELPQTRRTLRIDDRVVTRFGTKELGEIYAEPDAVEQLQKLEIGVEYLFSGTVGQRGRRYYAIIRNVSAYEQQTENIPELMSAIKLDGSTNQFNRVFSVLNIVMTDIHKDLFGYATANNLTLPQIFEGSEHRDKIAASARTALRRFEEKSKTTSQEFFISVIISMLALQYGYVEPAPPVTPDDAFNPDNDAGEIPYALPWGDDITPESWDIQSEPEAEPEADIVPEPDPAPEPEQPVMDIVEEEIPELELIETLDDSPVITEEVVEDVEEAYEPEAVQDAVESAVEEPADDSVEPPVVEPVAMEIDPEISEPVVDAEMEYSSADMEMEPEMEATGADSAPASEPVPEPEAPVTPAEKTPAIKDEIDYSRPVRLR